MLRNPVSELRIGIIVRDQTKHLRKGKQECAKFWGLNLDGRHVASRHSSELRQRVRSSSWDILLGTHEVLVFDSEDKERIWTLFDAFAGLCATSIRNLRSSASTVIQEADDGVSSTSLTIASSHTSRRDLL